MYNPGADYLSYKEHNTAIRKPRSKIVVDGVTYTGLEHLVTYPKITHETDKMIGGFPAKTCEFEIYNLDGNLNLNGKEVQVYRGLDISDEKTVWVPMGLFYADGDDVVNNSTKRTIQFKGTDRTRLFDSPFKNVYANGVVPMYTNLANIVIKICAAHKLTIDPSTKKNILSYALKNDAGTPEGTTDRQVIAWIAELSGCIPIISRDGNCLVFTRPKYTEKVNISDNVYSTGSYAKKTRYKSLTAEPKFGAINSISFGHADYDDAYVYQDESVGEDSICEWPINDNALAENEKKDIAPLVYEKIKGMSIVPFTLTDFIDDFLFDINDGILIQKKDGTTFTSYILGMSTSSRIRSAFKAGVQDTTAADRSLAGSVKNDIKKVKLSVDHVKNEITALAQDTDKQFTQVKQTANAIQADLVDKTQNLQAQITLTAEKATTAYSKAETVQGQVDGVTTQIESINNELSGLDDTIANKVTTEVQKDTTIEILAGKVNSEISGNYVTKTDYDDEKKNWVLLTDYNSRLEQTDQNITASVNRIQTLEDAGYITETQAQSMIDLQEDNITLSVEKNLKIGARNILLDSACFASFTPSGHNTQEVKAFTFPEQSLPSNKYRKVYFKSSLNGISGFIFLNSNIISQADNEITKLKTDVTYTLSFWLKKDSVFNPGNIMKSNIIYVGRNASVEFDNDRCVFPTVSENWQKYVLTFKIKGEIEQFYLRFLFDSCSKYTDSNGITYSAFISSLKLEEGNIATDWTPSETDLVSNATYNSFIELLPQKISLGVTETVTDSYVAEKIHSKCVSVELDTNGFTINNGAFILKDDEGEIMIDSTGIHSEYLNFGKTIDMETIKNGEVIDANDVDIWTLRNYTGSKTGMLNAKAAVSVMSNIPALKTLFWNNSNNWFCHNSSANTVTIANIDSVEETQTYILTFDYIGATTTNGKGLLPQQVVLISDKFIKYEVGVDNLTSGSATVNDKTYQYRCGSLSCSVRGYDLIKLRGGRSNNAVLRINLFSPSVDLSLPNTSTYWYYAMLSPTTDNMAFIGNIKLKTFVGATLNARALLNSNTDYFFDLGTGILSADEIGCKNLRAVSIPTSTATDTLKKVYIDETTGQLYREM